MGSNSKDLLRWFMASWALLTFSNAIPIRQWMKASSGTRERYSEKYFIASSNRAFLKESLPASFKEFCKVFLMPHL